MHDVQALIANYEVLNSQASCFRNAKICRLPQGLGLLPITDSFASEIKNYRIEFQIPIRPSIEHLTAGLVAFAKDLSFNTPVAYVTTFYFGGDGGQDAVVWINGKQEFDSSVTGYSQEWPNSSISQSLRKVGVVSESGKDEFDTVELGRYRQTDKWADSCKS